MINKNTKIWLNYLIGGAISVFLLWNIYLQVVKQVNGIGISTWRNTGPVGYLWACVVLMFANTSLEGYKWYLLTRSVEPIHYRKAFSSYLAGIGFALVTPNRIGEYPGRVLYIGKNNTLRYINVSILGVLSQLWAVYIFGLIGLVYYNLVFPVLWAKVALSLCIVANIAAALAYRRFDILSILLEQVKWLKKYTIYGQMVNKIAVPLRANVLIISLIRVGIFTAQYLFLLRWMNVNVPLPAGFCLIALFYWILAVIPSLSLTEVGIRGNVCFYLFQHYSSDMVGMMAATVGIWVLNLVIPAIIGSILIFRMRLVS